MDYPAKKSLSYTYAVLGVVMPLLLVASAYRATVLDREVSSLKKSLKEAEQQLTTVPPSDAEASPPVVYEEGAEDEYFPKFRVLLEVTPNNPMTGETIAGSVGGLCKAITAQASSVSSMKPIMVAGAYQDGEVVRYKLIKPHQ